jgi:uncharacterized protein (TIGR03790 family)
MLDVFVPTTKVYPEGTVTLQQSGEDIWGEGNLGWRYVKDVLADSIEFYLNNTYVNGQPLREKILYIVLVKGIPLKIRSLPYDSLTWDSKFRTHASVSVLLCLINQPDGRDMLQLYNTYYSSHLNPLYGVDRDLTMEYHFKSNHFVNSEGWYTQYLVSWLNGDTYSDVIYMIDRSASPELSGEKLWIIDDDLYAWWSDFSIANEKLSLLDIATDFDNTNDWTVTGSDSVIGYISNGVHTTYRMPATYILDTLMFDYVNGASFLSWESFNGWSFGVARAGQGLISDFIHMGGTGGSGHVYEPYATHVTQEKYTFPSYAMGYSIVDAQYHGIPINAWRNCVVGDPADTNLQL